MKDAIIKDIIITGEFLSDYASAPNRVRNRIDKLTTMILEGERLPKSMRPHNSPKSELWIGYVTINQGSWRLIFQEDLENPGTIIYLRLIDHDTMDRILHEDF